MLATEEPDDCNPSIVIEIAPGVNVKDALQAAKDKIAAGEGRVWGDGSYPGCGW